MLPLSRPYTLKVTHADGLVEDGLCYRVVTAGKAYRLQGDGVRPPIRGSAASR